MRHGNKINHLGRKTAHRDALLKNLSNALIKYKRIKTTLAKAKVLRGFIEPILTKTKIDNTHNRRIVFSYLQDKDSVKEMFSNISDKIMSRPGGYTRIIKLGFRNSDAAEMALIELVDFNETYSKDAKSVGTSKTRRGRKKAGAKTEADTTVTENNIAVEEAIVEEVANDKEVDDSNVNSVASSEDSDSTTEEENKD
ncbi:MAG: 50S ribosomal protein L17 [Chitinophagales bacterium]|jgi:large subunit ribosomal protein L17|nr:50S ribosomal protein L17 [Chitinophagales bacterium]